MGYTTNETLPHPAGLFLGSGIGQNSPKTNELDGRIMRADMLGDMAGRLEDTLNDTANRILGYQPEATSDGRAPDRPEPHSALEHIDTRLDAIEGRLRRAIYHAERLAKL